MGAWICPCIRAGVQRGLREWEYFNNWADILIYVDDMLCVLHDPGSPLVNLDEYFKMKEVSIQVPIF
jgi:hypothetical protein